MKNALPQRRCVGEISIGSFCAKSVRKNINTITSCQAQPVALVYGLQQFIPRTPLYCLSVTPADSGHKKLAGEKVSSVQCTSYIFHSCCIFRATTLLRAGHPTPLVIMNRDSQ